jgi:protein TonB
MNTLTAESFDIEGGLAWTRLLVAVAFSFALHLILLVGVPVNPTGGLPDVSSGSVITAQLESAPAASTESGHADVEAEPLPQTASSQPVEHKRAAAPLPSPSTGIEIPLIRDPTYYPVNQLDVKPMQLAVIKPAYPGAALGARLNGVVTLSLLIDEFGIVNEVKVVNADPPGYFEDSATAAFRAARFEPARRQGYPVKCRIVIKVNYDYEAEQGNQQH